MVVVLVVVVVVVVVVVAVVNFVALGVISMLMINGMSGLRIVQE